MPHYLYILSLANKNLYTGTTGDLSRRIQEHQSGKVTSTRYKRPLRLIHYETYFIKADAIRREKFLKTTEGKRLLRRQIKECLKQVL